MEEFPIKLGRSCVPAFLFSTLVYSSGWLRISDACSLTEVCPPRGSLAVPPLNNGRASNRSIRIEKKIFARRHCSDDLKLVLGIRRVSSKNGA